MWHYQHKQTWQVQLHPVTNREPEFIFHFRLGVLFTRVFSKSAAAGESVCTDEVENSCPHSNRINVNHLRSPSASKHLPGITSEHPFDQMHEQRWNTLIMAVIHENRRLYFPLRSGCG